MAHPKRRHSNTRTNLRRSHDGLKLQSLSLCTNCSARILPHRVCPTCGFYKGKQILTIKIKEKKAKR